MRPLFVRPLQALPKFIRSGGLRSRFPRPSGNGFGSNNLPSGGGNNPGQGQAMNQTWNVKRPPGNPNGNPKFPSQPGAPKFNWENRIWRAAKKALQETFEPEPIPGFPFDPLHPEFHDPIYYHKEWAEEEKKSRGYPSPYKFPDYGEYGPPEPQKPEVIIPSDDPDWPEPKEFPGMPPDSPKVTIPPGDTDWQTNLPPGTYTIEITVNGGWQTYVYDPEKIYPTAYNSGSHVSYYSGTVTNPSLIRNDEEEPGRQTRYFQWYIFATKLALKGFSEKVSLTGDPVKLAIPNAWGRVGGGEGYWRQVYGRDLSGYEIATTTIVVTLIAEKPATGDEPMKSKPNTKGGDDMSCPPCQARQMLRELSQTITVDAVTITKMPTGDLLTTQAPTVKRVFALPGTQEAIRDQFNLFAEIKKRTAHAFNQARKAKVLAKLQQLMSVTDFVLNLHNALMLSEDIAQTFFGTISGTVDIVIKLIDDTPFIGELFDLGETPVNSAEFFGKALEDKLKAIFGAPAWEAIKVKWAAVNNIVRNAAMQIQAARDIADAQRDLSEMTASRVGKLHNKLAKAGLLGDTDLWEEKVNRRWAWMYKLEDMASDNRFTNSAQFIQSWGGQVIDIREQQKEMETSREKFKTDLKADFDKITGEKAKTVADSVGSPYSRSDANPPATDDSQ